MRDRETGALWQHATGEALIGPLAGAKLEWLGGEQMTWAAWRTEHPDTVVALEPAEWSGMRHVPWWGCRVLEFATAHAAALPGLSANDRRLPMHSAGDWRQPGRRGRRLIPWQPCARPASSTTAWAASTCA